jgi:hypothetical protein
MIPEAVQFIFFDQHVGRVVFDFLKPSRSGQFSGVRLTVRGHVWEPVVNRGEYKPCVTHCRSLFERYCSTHRDLLQPRKRRPKRLKGLKAKAAE